MAPKEKDTDRNLTNTEKRIRGNIFRATVGIDGPLRMYVISQIGRFDGKLSSNYLITKTIEGAEQEVIATDKLSLACETWEEFSSKK